eukprot:CAMPEP_0171090200 /NCGR_PEP_ID=MMETSP0766_2-20121228/29519_1 /TAXON_ID=439317 /ORGANISM="Gambierdiscus australes, Strain CAWD 149" /LENGTH=224 /DNA_ID=CAMNT_0011548169 /DNA_START=46 /DNA_END=720 /DNA_ORIENTATION=-
MKGPSVQDLSMEKKNQSSRLVPGSTMLVVRNIPCVETIDHLQKTWPAEKLGWNYLYLPYSMSKDRSMGYAFINFTDHQHAVEFADSWHRSYLPGHAAHRPLSISMATVQSVGESLTSIKWDLLLQLAELGMEPVLIVQGQRVDTRFAYLALSRPRSACPPGGQTSESTKNKTDGFARSWVRSTCLSGGHQHKKPTGTDFNNDCTNSGVPEGEVPWPLRLAVLSL